MTVRTRMAPSPTGEYHIGSLRTLLYNYALAKKSGGEFILRIEDTDQKREVEGAKDRLMEVIKDYGFNWDEFYVQSERLEIYQKHAHELVEKGGAFYCSCEVGKHEKATCKKEKGNGDFVVRLKIPENEEVIVEDVLHGKVSFNSEDLDEIVLLKSDGFPTYHLAVVVDDTLMNITHVLRGIEWFPSTPKHVLLYKYFGWEVPVYAHLPNLKEKDQNKKLSKRFGDVDAISFLEKGYLVEAVLNTLMFLGWNPGTEKEIYSLEEFIKDFDLSRLQKTDLVTFDREKLLWFNGHYIRSLSPAELLKRIKDWAKKFNVDINPKLDEKIISLVQERLKVLSEINVLTSYFFEEPVVDKVLLNSYSDRAKEILEKFIELYKNENTWEVEVLDKKSHELLEKGGYKPKEAFMTIRVAVSGQTATPPLFDMLEALGKERVLARLDLALSLL